MYPRIPYEKKLYDFCPKNIQLNFCTTFVQFLCNLLQFLAHLSHSQIVQKLYNNCINLIECFLDKNHI